jgi:tetratricopeptide (TPR) repeat protein
VGRATKELCNAAGSLALFKLGDAARAKELYERALAIEEAVYGAYHVEVANTLTNLGLVQLRTPPPTVAPGHRRANLDGTALGELRTDLGDTARAKELLERALSIQEAAYGADHVNVAHTLGNLGKAYADLGDAARAKEVRERAKAIKSRSRNTHA